MKTKATSTEQVSCNICGGENPKPSFSSWDLLLNKETAKASFVECSQCGLVYQNPRPTPEQISEHYPPEYDPYIENGTESASWIKQKAKEYGISKRLRFITKHKNEGKILDIGCATGELLAALNASNENWDAFGVEIDEQAGQSAQKHESLNVFIGTVEEARYPNSFFDAVTMWDVLEHLHDPRSTIKEVFRILKPLGIFVIRVPNINSIDAKIFKDSWAGLDAPRHLYVFSGSTLTRLLREEGFFIQEINTTIGAYTTFVLSVRFWLTKRKAKTSLQEFVLKVLYHPITRFFASPIFFLIGASGNGPSLVVVAQKQQQNA